MSNANKMFEDYVYHSYRYYEKDDPNISDYEYDTLCSRLLKGWGEVTHPDKALTDEEALGCGSGYQMADSWPQWAIDRYTQDESR